MSGALHFEQPSFVSVESTLAEIASGDPERVASAIVAAALSSDEPVWIEACAIGLTNASTAEIRWAAVVSLGHLMRRFQRRSQAMELALSRLDDDERLAGVIADVRADIDVFRQR